MQTTLVRPQIVIVRPQGHVNASNVVEFQHQLTTAIRSSEHSMLLVDMERVESLDSAGLMALVSALRLANHLERRFGLCSVSPSIRIIFELTQLDQVFEIFDSAALFEAKARI